MGSDRKQPITYSDGVTEVRAGDVVTCRAWIWLFRKKRGRVVNVPGISKCHGGMEHGGLRWVKSRFDDGTVIGTVVDPDGHERAADRRRGSIGPGGWDTNESTT